MISLQLTDEIFEKNQVSPDSLHERKFYSLVGGELLSNLNYEPILQYKTFAILVLKADEKMSL